MRPVGGAAHVVCNVLRYARPSFGYLCYHAPSAKSPDTYAPMKAATQFDFMRGKEWFRGQLAEYIAMYATSGSTINPNHQRKVLL
jgi:hypothetical protein